jgi:hypothetical protein
MERFEPARVILRPDACGVKLAFVPPAPQQDNLLSVPSEFREKLPIIY